MKEIYFDNAATTKISPEALDIFISSMNNFYGNPSSLHKLGFLAETQQKSASEKIAKLLKVESSEIYFTSGGTLSNNIAIFGAMSGRKRTHDSFVTTKIEHASVTAPFQELSQMKMDVSYIDSSLDGLDLEGLKNSLTEKTALVSLSHVNSETGHINDINRIGKIIKENSSAYFHVDGVQSFGKIPIDLENVDMLSFSSHKIHGPRGIGGLYINKGISVKPFIFGGSQQNGFLPGTENTNAAAAFACAAESAFENMAKNRNKVAETRNCLLEIANTLDGVSVNSPEDGSPYILNLSFTGVNAETLLNALSAEGVCVSAGSACSGKNLKNNVLARMGVEKERSGSALRFSFSKYNTVEEAYLCARLLEKTVPALRKYRRR